MTRATERWQDQIRYAADTGTVPRLPRTGLRRFGRRFLIALVGLVSAFVAVSSYATRRSNDVPSPVIQPATKVALATPEPTKRRSFTGTVSSEATPPLGEPAFAQATARAAREDVMLDPETTGTISTDNAAPNASERTASTASERPKSRQGRLSSDNAAKPRSRVLSAHQRSNRREPHLASRPGPGRVVAAATAQPASPCLFFVACF